MSRVIKLYFESSLLYFLSLVFILAIDLFFKVEPGINFKIYINGLFIFGDVMDYSKYLKATPQTEPIPGKDMVMNNAGGYTFKISNWDKLDRFLFLGTEGGSYYVGEPKLTLENCQNVINCIKEDGPRVVKRIVEISSSGRAFKNDPAIFALVLVLTHGNEETKKLGYHSLNQVCRIGTHLFTFCTAIKNTRGWSGGLRRAVARYYTSKTPDKLVYDLLKYQSRNGFSHRDVLRLAHVKPETKQQAGILGYAVGKQDVPYLISHKMIEAVHNIKTETNVKKIVKAIVDHNLPREVIPTQFLNTPEVWEALLLSMPITALVRNLGKMSSIGLTPDVSFSSNVKLIVDKLTSAENISHSKIHPLSVLLAFRVYEQGQGVKGSLTWEKNLKILQALSDAFYLSFSNVVPTNKNILLSLDVSGSMTSRIGNTPLSSMEVCAAFAMVTARTEPNYEIMGFSNIFMKLNITASTPLDVAMKRINGLPFSSTDCSLPFIYAYQNKLPVDVFGVYTDNETFFGRVHPKQALDMFRKEINPKAKSYIVATEANSFSIADPSDPGMLDIAGFDSNLPSIIDCFIRG